MVALKRSKSPFICLEDPKALFEHAHFGEQPFIKKVGNLFRKAR